MYFFFPLTLSRSLYGMHFSTSHHHIKDFLLLRNKLQEHITLPGYHTSVVKPVDKPINCNNKRTLTMLLIIWPEEGPYTHPVHLLFVATNVNSCCCSCCTGSPAQPLLFRLILSSSAWQHVYIGKSRNWQPENACHRLYNQPEARALVGVNAKMWSPRGLSH